jgi:hypothetical protein
MRETFRRFYEMYLGPLPHANERGEVQVRSCFRNDQNPSMFINLHDGRYNDFGGDHGGDAYNFYMEMHGVNFSTAKRAVDKIVGNPSEDSEDKGFAVALPIPDEQVEKAHANLLRNPNLLRYLVEERGISLDVIKRRKIGHDGERYTIPIYNKFNVCVNIRRYMPNAQGGNKMINYARGYGQARLYPLDALEKSTVIIHEGEWDTLLQESHGFSAITNTAGARTWLSQWNDLFKGKTVYVCYDKDETGVAGAEKVAANLYGVASKVLIATLPLKGTPDDKDISDYYLNHEHTSESFMEVLSSAVEYSPTDNELADVGRAIPTTLIEARSSSFKHKFVEFDVMVVGKDTAPYNIPAVRKFTCSSVGLNEKMCAQCQVGRCGGEYVLTIPRDPDMLELIRASKQQQTGLVKRMAGIPQNCNLFQAEDLESVNIEEILIAPELQTFSEWNGEGSSYLLQSAFFVDGNVDANRSYRMRGVMTPDPWTQQVTFLLTEKDPLQDSIASFKLTPEIMEKLSIFQTDDIPGKFKEIHTDFEDNVTHIVGRSDLLTGIDLAYHSVLGFSFQGVPIRNGWIDFLCIGDTRTGKSETTSKMLQFYGLGEMSVAENTSFAGLVGGLQQTGNKRWFLTWGKLPLNDGRLFVIDEASGLSLDEIAMMSGIRASGIAEVTKIQTERTSARTRLIWLSNSRSGRPLESYSYGVLAVPELIGKSEDISRFDFVIAASRDEVPLEVINKRVVETDKVPHIYTSDLCKTLILWAWSRKPDDVVFEEEAVNRILRYAIKMGQEYSSRIPLVEGANQRIKLAKISVAVAARVFSTDATGEKVVVKAPHVDFAYQFLEEIYSKPSFDYKGYSERELEDVHIANKYRDEVLKYLESFPMVAELFLRQEHVWPRHLEEQLGLMREACQEHIAFFTRTRMIQESDGKGYRKTPAFIRLLREWRVSQGR